MFTDIIPILKTRKPRLDRTGYVAQYIAFLCYEAKTQTNTGQALNLFFQTQADLL